MKYLMAMMLAFSTIISCNAQAADSDSAFTLNTEFAQAFADDWIASWNAHDLDRIMAHYTDDFSMSSPLIVSLMNEPSGTLHGKEAVGVYWTLALSRMPDLRFELESILLGANSITLVYQGARGLSAEVFNFNTDGKVETSSAHYSVNP